MKITLTGLTPYTIYSIQVALVNAQGDVGPYSTPVAADTEEASKYTHNLLTDKMFHVNDILPSPGSSGHHSTFLLSTR